MARMASVETRALLAPETALRVGERAVEDRRHFVVGQPAQDEHLRSREQRRVDLERRVLGRRADEHDVAGFDARQEGVLLRLVEPVDLVDEHDGPAAGGSAKALGLRHHVADFLDPRQDRAERHEARSRGVRDDPRQRRLAGAGRTPEDDGLQEVAFDRFAQRLAGRQQLLLADEFVERPRPHPLGQWRTRGRGAGFVGEE